MTTIFRATPDELSGYKLATGSIHEPSGTENPEPQDSYGRKFWRVVMGLNWNSKIHREPAAPLFLHVFVFHLWATNEDKAEAIALENRERIFEFIREGKL